jgi:hypothetical protein
MYSRPFILPNPPQLPTHGVMLIPVIGALLFLQDFPSFLPSFFLSFFLVLFRFQRTEQVII